MTERHRIDRAMSLQITIGAWQVPDPGAFVGALPKTETSLSSFPPQLRSAVTASAPSEITDTVDRFVVSAAPSLLGPAMDWYRAATPEARKRLTLLSLLPAEKRTRIDEMLSRKLSKLDRTQRPEDVLVVVGRPAVPDLDAAARTLSLRPIRVPGMGELAATLAESWRPLLLLADGDLCLAHESFNDAIRMAGYALVASDGSALRGEGWEMRRVRTDRDLRAALARAVEVRGVRWRSGALGLRDA